ncbi:hypothetical protein OLX02_03550 [Novosphingobium sp. KCTC 2891]|uniref:hypothetical protein n=1 Tax=Novosphingobium sp. KCTC 2891 TaxID=2989730 RepID=UPI00222147E9|nr:hypothetical protein [Novosphingobium sp. KCTC 2891]MCW1381891.1 hypothetical protein [Novosphingobium sp. KCTC 2891]
MLLRQLDLAGRERGRRRFVMMLPRPYGEYENCRDGDGACGTGKDLQLLVTAQRWNGAFEIHLAIFACGAHRGASEKTASPTRSGAQHSDHAALANRA